MASSQPDTFGERVRAAREHWGWSQEEYARKAGVSAQTIKRYEKREEVPSGNRSVTTLENVAEAARVRLDWLKSGKGEMLLPGQDNGKTDEPAELQVAERADDAETRIIEQEGAKIARVPLVSVVANGGVGEEPFTREVDGYLSFDERQIRTETGVSPRRLVALPITGNSMKPTLNPGDKAIVARGGTEGIRHGAIYVFYREHMGHMVKRAFWQGNDTLLLRSDNRNEPVDFEIVPGDEQKWRVIGRVVKVIKDL